MAPEDDRTVIELADTARTVRGVGALVRAAVLTTGAELELATVAAAAGAVVTGATVLAAVDFAGTVALVAEAAVTCEPSVARFAAPSPAPTDRAAVSAQILARLAFLAVERYIVTSSVSANRT
jgi:hypothetical protein